MADATKSLVIEGGWALEFMFGGNNAKPTSVVIKDAGNHSLRLATQLIEWADADLIVDAHQATGELTIDVSDFEGSKGETATVLASSGNDTIRLGGRGSYAKFVVNAGAGADTIETIHGTEMWVTTDAGSDTIRMSISDPPVPIPTKLVITDFTPGAGVDRLAFENLLSVAFVFDKDGVDGQAKRCSCTPARVSLARVQMARCRSATLALRSRPCQRQHGLAHRPESRGRTG